MHIWNNSMQFSCFLSTTPLSTRLQIESSQWKWSLFFDMLMPALTGSHFRLASAADNFKVSRGYFKVTVTFAYFEEYTLLHGLDLLCLTFTLSSLISAKPMSTSLWYQMEMPVWWSKCLRRQTEEQLFCLKSRKTEVSTEEKCVKT